jgi:hypothetical protein
MEVLTKVEANTPKFGSTPIKDNKDNIPPISPKKKKQKTQLTDKFPLTDKLRKYALSKNILSGKIDELFEAFKDHHIGHQTLMGDWNRGWYTWIRNAPQFSAWACGSEQNYKTPHDIEREDLERWKRTQ